MGQLLSELNTGRVGSVYGSGQVGSGHKILRLGGSCSVTKFKFFVLGVSGWVIKFSVLGGSDPVKNV